MLPTINVDLSRPPEQRWVLSAGQVKWAKSLLTTHLEEIGGVDPYLDLIEEYATGHVPEPFRHELESIAAQCSRPYLDALTANLYYDFLKLLLGCTAFAVNTPNGPLHARNMDWFSNSNCLSEYTTIVLFHGRRPFEAIGWPGYVGVLSGVAPGRFAITMNAALSDDPQVFGASIAFLIRDTFETCDTFADAVKRLSTTTITSDCLLHVTGPQENEMLVIERTPTRHAHRHAVAGRLVLTNDFRVLEQPRPNVDSPIYESTCSRFEAAEAHLNRSLPAAPEECFAVLDSDGVRMGITVQRMVMSARTGEVQVRTEHTP